VGFQPAILSEVTYTYDLLSRLATVNTVIRDGTPVGSNPMLAGNQPETTSDDYDFLSRMEYTEIPNSVVEDFTFYNMDRQYVMRYPYSDSNNENFVENIAKDRQTCWSGRKIWSPSCLAPTGERVRLRGTHQQPPL